MEKEIKDPAIELWQGRYGAEEYAYGKSPNLFFSEWLKQLSPKSILMPADGEGRNGVYAATLGWKVTSFDISAAGRTKALELARENNVGLDYHIGSLEDMNFKPETFDAIGLIYAHFPPDKISVYHKTLSTMLRPGGMVILEAFGKDHLQYSTKDPKIGGPRQADMLFSTEGVKADFDGYEIALLEEKTIELNEGLYHIGKGSALRFVARKPY